MTSSRWRIKHKLTLGVVVLVVMVSVLGYSGIKGVYAYRQLVRQIAERADELPLLTNLTSSLDSLHQVLTPVLRTDAYYPAREIDTLNQLTWYDFQLRLGDAQRDANAYREQLGNTDGQGIADRSKERETIEEIQRRLEELKLLDRSVLIDVVQLSQTSTELQSIVALSRKLPEFLQDRMTSLHGEVRGAYRAMIVTSWVTTVLGVMLLIVFMLLFHVWIFRPLGILLAGSRRVAGGEFRHRIVLDSNDEMAELAGAMNAMTTRFQEIRDELDQQVRERTREVVQSEQLASVGFLAAGVAHEINNPLAAIAMSAESLEPRIGRLIGDIELPEESEEQLQIVQKYLRRIQEESFRCKGITERLLDFSRLGNVEPEETDLRELTIDIIDMLQEIGVYKGKAIEFQCDQHVTAWVNAQEIKQVLLNLITNALDSLDPRDGVVTVSVKRGVDVAQIVVRDNGCGMSEEVRQHLFEPFFTRRRDGAGTGLGLSITYRIVTDHGGRIEAHSDGPGAGSTLCVTLPVRPTDEQEERKVKAA